MRHGWLAIPGVQTGDRTLEEQVAALRPAIEEAQGKTVLDLGCSEGLIGREFALAGAAKVYGLEALPDHLAVASRQCKGLPMEFHVTDLNVGLDQLLYSADIVLALGIAHKLQDPGRFIRFAADSSRDLVLIRSGLRADENGIINSKHWKTTCDSHAIMRGRGFELEKKIVGPAPHFESVEYWRRKK